MDLEITKPSGTPIDDLVKAANKIDSSEQPSPAVVRKMARTTPPEPFPSMIDSKIPLPRL